MTSVLLLKAMSADSQETDTYEYVLSHAKFRVKSAMTLEFEFKNLEILTELLKTPERFAGLIATSPRIITGLQEAMHSRQLDEAWKAKKNFAVGPTTSKLLRSIMGVECSSTPAGNASALGDIILQEAGDSTLPFLYPKGNLARDTVKQKVPNTYDVVIYDTIPKPHFERHLEIITKDFTTHFDFLVFFSPSGVQIASPYLHRFQTPYKILAIGPTTEEALKSSGIAVSGVPSSPSASALVDLLNSFKEEKSINTSL